eukprot:scaffold18670_cov78-Skeletonema_dohrnii-CCMP3373.AAC.2
MAASCQCTREGIHGQRSLSMLIGKDDDDDDDATSMRKEESMLLSSVKFHGPLAFVSTSSDAASSVVSDVPPLPAEIASLILHIALHGRVPRGRGWPASSKDFSEIHSQYSNAAALPWKLYRCGQLYKQSQRLC